MSTSRDVEMGPQCLHAMGVTQPTRVRPINAATSIEADPPNADALDAAFKGITSQVIVSVVVLAVYWNAKASCDMFQLKVWVAVFTGHTALYASIAHYMFENRAWLKEHRKIETRLKAACGTIECTGLVCFVVGNCLVWAPGRMCTGSAVWILSVVLLVNSYLQLLCLVLPLLIVLVCGCVYCVCCWSEPDLSGDVRITIQGPPLPTPVARRVAANGIEYSAVHSSHDMRHDAAAAGGVCFLLGACCMLWTCCVCCAAAVGVSAGAGAQERQRHNRM